MSVFYWRLPKTDEAATETKTPFDLYWSLDDFDKTPEEYQVGEDDWTILPEPEDV